MTSREWVFTMAIMVFTMAIMVCTMAIMVFTRAIMVCTTLVRFVQRWLGLYNAGYSFATYRKDWGVVVCEKK